MGICKKYCAFVLLILILVRCTYGKSSKPKSIPINKVHGNEISNSYSELYTKYNINYTYFAKSQIHDYSDNWDLDGDGILDRIMFVGDGAAHLNYRLLIYISSIDDFVFYPYLFTDRPIYTPIDSLKKNNSVLSFFTVYDFNADGKDEIYFNLISNNCIPDTLKSIGIKTPKIILNYNEKKKLFEFNDFYSVETKNSKNYKRGL